MNDHPIIFTGQSVRDIYAGKKTQTRRVITRLGGCHEFYAEEKILSIDQYLDLMKARGFFPMIAERECPYGLVGSKLWVKETWNLAENDEGAEFPQYRANIPEVDWKLYGPWNPARFMPKWVARLWLKITDIRIERLQDINEDDARAEGASLWTPEHESLKQYTNGSYRNGYHEIWDKVNAKRGYPWKDNPWVWVINFKLLEMGR